MFFRTVVVAVLSIMAACAASDESVVPTHNNPVQFEEVAVLPVGPDGATELKVFNFRSDATGLVLRARPSGKAPSLDVYVVIDSVSTVEGQAWIGQFEGDGNTKASGMQNSALMPGEAVVILPNHGLDLLATTALTARILIRDCANPSIPPSDLPEAMVFEVGWLERPTSVTPLTVSVEFAYNQAAADELLTAINAIFSPAKITFKQDVAGVADLKIVTGPCPAQHSQTRIPGGLTHLALSNVVTLAACGEDNDTASAAREAAHQLAHFLGLYSVTDDTLDDTVVSVPNLMSEMAGDTQLTLSQIHVLRTHPLARAVIAD
ncbi:MAG TPA: hypothetical protein EYN66_15205 [Myxococcales bacterium]|nr:hypothetical protein [Myxococcales bacterium]